METGASLLTHTTWQTNGSSLTIHVRATGWKIVLAETASHSINAHTMCRTFSRACGSTGFCTNSKTGLWLYDQPRESSVDDDSVRHCDRSQGTKVDNASRPLVIHIAHSSSHACTNTTGDLSPAHTEISPSSYYLLPLYLSLGAHKAWIELWDGNQELNISAFIKLPVTPR